MRSQEKSDYKPHNILCHSSHLTNTWCTAYPQAPHRSMHSRAITPVFFTCKQISKFDAGWRTLQA